ncbi:hypothetical protein IFM89_018728 [Coptis chinensis]|uniref:Uncharacterized protein n=1 Tax=Coptis chinensis TaxID=261450 RepID=A0A835IBJ7_9MAGN|nr:hypothetical protein IFM89_018728 [Coptis chinensis]
MKLNCLVSLPFPFPITKQKRREQRENSAAFFISLASASSVAHLDKGGKSAHVNSLQHFDFRERVPITSSTVWKRTSESRLDARREQPKVWDGIGATPKITIVKDTGGGANTTTTVSGFLAIPWGMMAISSYIAGVASDALIKKGHQPITFVRTIMQRYRWTAPGMMRPQILRPPIPNMTVPPMNYPRSPLGQMALAIPDNSPTTDGKRIATTYVSTGGPPRPFRMPPPQFGQRPMPLPRQMMRGPPPPPRPKMQGRDHLGLGCLLPGRAILGKMVWPLLEQFYCKGLELDTHYVYYACPFCRTHYHDAASKSQSCKSSSLVTNRGKQNDNAGKKRSLFDSKKKNGRQIENGEVDDKVGLPDYGCHCTHICPRSSHPNGLTRNTWNRDNRIDKEQEVDPRFYDRNG